jgi:hypothetical protein
MYYYNLGDLDDRIEDRDVKYSILRGATCVADDWYVASV